jgi:hypothetical protein
MKVKRIRAALARQEPALGRQAALTDVCTLDPPLTPEAAMGRLLTALWRFYSEHSGGWN